jgi:hypothetical protein
VRGPLVDGRGGGLGQWTRRLALSAAALSAEPNCATAVRGSSGRWSSSACAIACQRRGWDCCIRYRASG